MHHRKTITLPKEEQTQWAEYIHRHKALQARREYHDERGDLCELIGAPTPPTPQPSPYVRVVFTKKQAYLILRNVCTTDYIYQKAIKPFLP